MTKQRLFATVAAVGFATGVNFTFVLPALAQQQNAQVDAGLEEIIVTARKRAENLLEVPLSITAFTEQNIEQAGIDNIADLATQTVGFSYRQGFGRIGSGNGGATNRPSIRGMSNILGSANSAFFVDGVYISGNPSSYQLDNLQRIEVIRGPQSALFGRGTFAGAVNFVTRRPDNEFRGKAEITVGQYDRFEGTGYISGPVIEDKLFMEVSGRYYSFGGDYFNQVTQKRDIGDQKTKNGGLKIYATPTEDLSVEVNVGYAQDQDLGYADFFHGNTKNNCFLPRLTTPFAGIPRSTTRSQGYFCGEIEIPNQYFYWNDAIRAADLWSVDRIARRYSLTADYDINDWTLHYVMARNESADNQLIDNFVDGNRRPGSVVLDGGHTAVHDTSFEFRVQSPQESNLRGILGAYYYREGNEGGFTRRVSVIPATIGQTTILNGYADDASGVRNKAIFGLLDYDATEDLTFSFEARYQEDNIFADQDRDGDIDTRLPSLDGESTYKSFLPRFIAKYTLEDGSNVYASVAKGNKPCGFNTLPIDITPTDLNRAVADGVREVKEEELWAYEVGYKASLMDNMVTLSTAAFYNDWSNQGLTSGYPYQRLSNGTFTTIARVVNAGKSRVMGIELDANVRPSDFFDFRVGYNYNNAEIRDFVDEVERDLRDTDGIIGNEATQGDPTGQVRGNKIPQTPSHQLILSGNLHADVFEGAQGFLRADLNYETKRYDQVHNLTHTGDSYRLNLRTGVEMDNGLTVTFYVNNALDDKTPEVITRLFNFNASLLIPDPIQRFAGQPLRFTFFRDYRVAAPRKRAWGITTSYKF